MKMSSALRSRRDARAFTLLELLVVMLIVAILAGVIFAAGPGILRAARKTATKNEIQQLRIAIAEYYNEYGRYPVEEDMQGRDVMVGEGGSANTGDLMYVLLAEDAGWNSGHRLNPKRIVFLTNVKEARGSGESPRGGIAEDGRYFDIWGNEFRILLDTDYNDEIDASENEMFDYEDMEVTDAGVFRNLGGILILSYGEDKEMGRKGNGNYRGSDDVCSFF